MVLQESGEMYLETIYVLSHKKSFVRAKDVSEQMGVTRPSVSRAIHLLEDGGFLNIEESSGIRLTELGQELAAKIYERHLVMTRYFVSLGMDAETASNDACRIEHVISDETFAAVKNHMAAMKH